MSLTTMTSRSRGLSAMLFSASQAMPPVSAPSPTTATTVRSSPDSRNPFAMPSAQASAVEACEFATQSCSDSAGSG